MSKAKKGPLSSLLDDSDFKESRSPAARWEYPASLPHDIACCVTDEDLESVLLKHGITEQDYETFSESGDFRREYSEWQQRLIGEGNSFRMKARALAEEGLPTMHQLMHSEQTAPSVRADIFKYLTKVAELEPEKKDPTSSSNHGGPRVVVQIANFSNPSALPTRQVVEISELPELPDGSIPVLKGFSPHPFSDS